MAGCGSGLSDSQPCLNSKPVGHCTLCNEMTDSSGDGGCLKGLMREDEEVEEKENVNEGNPAGVKVIIKVKKLV